MLPRVLTIVGEADDSGRQLLRALASKLEGRGWRVAAADCERPGEVPTAGAAIRVSQHSLALVTGGWPDTLHKLQTVLSDRQLIIVYGSQAHARDVIEIVAPGGRCRFAASPALQAVVSESDPGCSREWFKPEEIDRLSDFIEERFLAQPVSGAVLAGGRSSRLGRNKALVEIHGRPVVQQVLETMSQVVSPVRIITNHPQEYAGFGCELFGDVLPECGPLSGIHAALCACATEYVMVLSCDMPLVTVPLLEHLKKAAPGYDITIYKHKNFEPLCAVYRRSCLPALEELIAHKECRIIDLFPTLSVQVVRTDDPDVFRSINTEDDLQFITQRLQAP